MAEIAVAVRSTLRESYPELSVIDLVPFSEHLRRSLFEEKINADVAGSIAALGLVLAMIGVASVNGYSVRRRVREIGIRMALGASSGDAFRLVLREAMLWVGAGVAVGWLAALALGQVLKSMLYGVGAHDPLTFVTVPLILVAVAALATWLPARRAARVDPATALREE
jgi:ABC-type antimicrobial peptide transport system permease subunit